MAKYKLSLVIFFTLHTTVALQKSCTYRTHCAWVRANDPDICPN